ncbi:hypothetical protein PHIN3_154 [Sinorhizobium phage phiN3]|uniref:DUF2188 domain-containing protein n=1 Tax=Sinorhizobium phage phiN3 TaxID=1647405 RepID=A0A0F6WCU2_9CAUD|nr:hypothetical protein AVT40_gp379 [Sinorhizobium phage phiN3]AKF13417.1 hypothetical protein PHIN3_154 [Sinorhizobium phage phiN3]
MDRFTVYYKNEKGEWEPCGASFPSKKEAQQFVKEMNYPKNRVEIVADTPVTWL